jgi:hypothetical protein
MPCGSKKEEPRYTCLSEAKASHSQRMWAEFSSSAPHLHNGLSDRSCAPHLHNGLSDILCSTPTQWTVWQPHSGKMSSQSIMSSKKASNRPGLCPIKDGNLALAPRQGPEINSRACLCVLPRPRQHTQCCLTNQRLNHISCLETPKDSWGPTNIRAEPPLASLSLISFRTQACPGTQYSPTA